MKDPGVEASPLRRRVVGWLLRKAPRPSRWEGESSPLPGAIMDRKKPDFRLEFKKMGSPAPLTKSREFNPTTFLATIGEGRKNLTFAKKQGIFAQGDVADAVFYLQRGKVKLTVVSKTGREATIGLLTEG